MEIFSDLNFVFFVIFFAVALIYSSVGLGGGSSYTALMVLFGVQTAAIPLISLVLNVFVTTIGSYHFIKHNHGRFKLIFPFLISSVPAAYLGGTIHLPKQYFYIILLISLIFVAFRIYVWQDTAFKLNLSSFSQMVLCLVSGAVLGLIAGIVGIGGGIYLVPLIILLGLGTHKEAAACGSIFIWLNSVSGLIARLQFNAIDLKSYLPLIAVVLAGGFIGSFMGAVKLSHKTMEKILGSVVLIAIVFLSKKILL